MHMITEPYNVYMGRGRTSRITWDEFKDKASASHNWIYDEENKAFYVIYRGVYRYITKQASEEMAANCGYFKDLSDYIDDDGGYGLYVPVSTSTDTE